MKSICVFLGVLMAFCVLSPAFAVKTTESTPSGNTKLTLTDGSTVTFKATKKITKEKEATDLAGTPARVVVFKLADGTSVELTYANTNTLTPTVVAKGSDGKVITLSAFAQTAGGSLAGGQNQGGTQQIDVGVVVGGQGGTTFTFTILNSASQ